MSLSSTEEFPLSIERVTAALGVEALGDLWRCLFASFARC